MKQARRFADTRPTAELASAPARAAGATALWSSPEGWRIGRQDSNDRGLLAEVLRHATDEREWQWDEARAWSLLLNLEVNVGVITLLGSLAAKLGFGRMGELTPFFAMHAERFPVPVASLFPQAIEPMVLPLCGSAGVAAALQVLRSRDKGERTAATEGLIACLDAGLQLPLAAIHDALRRETDRDIVDRLEDLVATIRAKKLDGATRRMIAGRLFGDGADPATVAEEFSLPLETVLQLREQEAQIRTRHATAEASR